jgi:hypothetical protein
MIFRTAALKPHRCTDLRSWPQVADVVINLQSGWAAQHVNHKSMRSLIRRAGKSLDAPLQRFWKFRLVAAIDCALEILGSQKALPRQIEAKELRQAMPHARLPVRRSFTCAECIPHFF